MAIQTPTSAESTERRGLRLLGHSDLEGHGDAMQMMLHGSYLYVGHVGTHGTSILDVSDPRRPRVVGRLEAPAHASAPKAQVGDGLLLVNSEQRGAEEVTPAGFAIYALDDPANPRQVGFFETGGKGVHRIWYTGGRCAYVSAVPDGFDGRILVIVDVSNPERPQEVCRWWWPGMWTAGGETPTWPAGIKYQLHHAIVAGDRAYAGFWDGGLVIFDIGQIDQPKVIAHVPWAPEGGGNTHTALPLLERNLLVVTDEAVRNNCQEAPKRIRVFDIADDRDPKLLSTCPVPEGDFCERGLWFGPHNLHENRPGTMVSDQRVYATYCNAGVRIFDISDPAAPKEEAYYVPPPGPGKPVCQSNDILVTKEEVIFVSDRVGGGVTILERE